MYAGHEEEEIHGWQAAGEVLSDGWPLGLQQTPMRRAFPEAPALFISTPSITSESSSDLDTESTGSFFPERSQTLGSLIGLQSIAQKEQSKTLMTPVEAHSMATETEQRRRSTGSVRAGRPSWCPMLGCGGGSNPAALGMSPSLAHLLEEERRATTGSQRHSAEAQEYREAGEAAGRSGGAAAASLSNMPRNTLFNEEGILPPQPSGAPLKLILQHESPNSSYLSADWNVFNARHPHHAREGGAAGGSHGRFPTFWPGFCGRLGTGIAG